MSASLNKVMIIGNLGADPELRYTNNNQAVTTLSVATHEAWGGKDGSERQERTEWHKVVVFGRTAENCANYLKKGRSVFVEGRLQTRDWEDKDGNKRYTTEIVANTVQFLSGGGGEGGSEDFGGGGGGYSGGGGGGGGRSGGGGGGGGGGGRSGGGGGGGRSGGGGGGGGNYNQAFDDDDIPF